FPYLSSVALDVLPIQASSVPCERMFSSAKETTMHRHATSTLSTDRSGSILLHIWSERRIM
ncbi:hypothetical protein M407DRAFT_44887, partial [Tulasnella calospora MUT 4182]